MPRTIKAYVRFVGAINRVLASISQYVFNVPFLWIIEMARFLMAAYYLLGGGYSMQLDSHVRMDVLYDHWAPKSRAFWDSLTAICLVLYRVFLFTGGISSSAYALTYGQRNYSAWAALMAPIKIIMTVGITIPPSVVLVLYGMIARQPVGQLWLAGVFPGLLMAGLFLAYIMIRCQFQPQLGPALPLSVRRWPP